MISLGWISIINKYEKVESKTKQNSWKTNVVLRTFYTKSIKWYKKITCMLVNEVILPSGCLKSWVFHDNLIGVKYCYKNLTTRCCTTYFNCGIYEELSITEEVRLVWYTNNNVIQVEVAAFSTSAAFCRVFETTE